MCPPVDIYSVGEQKKHSPIHVIPPEFCLEKESIFKHGTPSRERRNSVGDQHSDFTDYQMQKALEEQYENMKQTRKSSLPPTVVPETKRTDQEESSDKFASLPAPLCDLISVHTLIVGSLLSDLPSKDRRAVLNRMVPEIEVQSSSIRLAELVPGSTAWLEELRHACKVCGSITFSSTRFKLTSIQLALALFSWDTDGGPMTAVQARPHLSGLHKLPELPASISAQIMTDVWTGVALRLCDTRHLENIDMYSREWRLLPREDLLVQRHKVLASCEINVVHLLSSTNSLKGLWKQSPTQFSRKLTKILCTLERLASSDHQDKVVVQSRLLTSRIIEFAEVLAHDGSGKIAEDEGDAAHGMEHPLKSIIERFSGKEFSTSRNLLEGSLILPRSASETLSQFGKEKNVHFRNVLPVDWDLWISSLKASEDFWKGISHPTYRGAPGFWLVRDLHIKMLEEFGSVFERKMPQTSLSAKLSTTPILRAIMCRDNSRPLLWPHAVLEKNPFAP